MPEQKTPVSGAFWLASLMYFCSGQPMHFCSGVDNPQRNNNFNYAKMDPQGYASRWARIFAG